MIFVNGALPWYFKRQRSQSLALKVLINPVCKHNGDLSSRCPSISQLQVKKVTERTRDWVSSYLFLLPVQFIDGHLHLVHALADRVVGRVVLRLQVVRGLLERREDRLSQMLRVRDLGHGAIVIVTTEVFPLLRSGAPGGIKRQILFMCTSIVLVIILQLLSASLM